MSSENEADRVCDFAPSITINHREGPEIFNRNTESWRGTVQMKAG
jgi:hypothetical protein